ncbi:MAG: CopG family transcriptional regulator [Xanthobacteraceae bacterium]
MRTTLDIDDDVLNAAKQLAKKRNSTAGEVISGLARIALTQPSTPDEEPRYRNGFRLLPRTGQIITSEMVRKWLEEDV